MEEEKENKIMAERITGHTELIGLMAYPIRHSSSPAMHNEAFAYLGLDYAYLAFEVDNSTLEDAVKGLRALKMVGSNVSMPNKQLLDSIWTNYLRQQSFVEQLTQL